MFVCISQYLDTDAVTKIRPDHIEWLEAQIAETRILCAGRKTDGSGGVLVIPGDDEAAARDLVAGDPYVQAGAAEYAWTTFTASRTAPAIAGLAESA